jgi:hypothetical protein
MTLTRVPTRKKIIYEKNFAFLFALLVFVVLKIDDASSALFLSPFHLHAVKKR